MIVWWQFLLLSVLVLLLGLFIVLGVARFSALVGSVFVRIERKTEEWGQACARAASAFLVVSSSPEEQYGFAEQMDILFSRLIHLLLAVLFIAGEAYNAQLVVPVLFHLPASLPPWPRVFDLATSVLFIIPPALFGIVLLEVTGYVPLREGLFPTKLSLWQRIPLAVYAAVFLVISFLVVSSSWQYRAVYLDPVARQALNPQALSALAEYVLYGLGLLAAGGSLLIFQAFRIGWKSALAVFLYIVSLGLACVSFLAQLVARLLEGISLHFSHNRLSPYDLPPDPVKQVRASVRGNRLVEPLDEDSVIAYPLLPPGEQEAMKTDKTGAIVFAGQWGSELFSAFAQSCRVLRGAEVLLTSGGFHRASQAERFVLPGTQDIAPTVEDKKYVLDMHLNATDEIIYAKLLSRIAEYLIKAHREKGLEIASAPILCVLDPHMLIYASDMLRAVKKDLPSSCLAMVTALTASDLTDERVRSGLTMCQSLWQERVLATTLVVDPQNAPFRKAGQDKQTMLRFLAHGLMCLLVAKRQYPANNLSGVEVLAQLQRSSAFMTVSFASAPVEPGRLPGRYWWRALLPRTQTQRGTCDLGLLVSTLKALTSQVMDNAHAKHLLTRSLGAFVNPQLPAFVLCAVPLTQKEEEKLRQVKENLDWFVETNYPPACALLARANGLPYVNQLPSAYLAQAHCFYPVQNGVLCGQTIDAAPETMALPQAPGGQVPSGQEREAEREADESEALAPFPVESSQKEMSNGAGNTHMGSAQSSQGQRPKSDKATSPAGSGKKRGRPRKAV